jgi:ribosomal protein L11 methyltransferase
MEIEIEISGPSHAISKLHGEIKLFLPGVKNLQGQHGGNDEIARIVLKEKVEDLDNRLLEISRIVNKLEKDLFLEKRLEFRVRNLAYSEPSTGSSLFRDPFNPIPSITIQPWNPSISQVKDSYTIIIDPHHAFGTGKHPTTRLCLKYMDHLAQIESPDWRLQGREVLDFGCGTGLLAIAAVKMGAKKAVGVEIDHQSVETARRNVELNSLDSRITIREGSWEIVHEKYDLILANLVPAAILRTGQHIPNRLKDHGKAVLSGFGNNQRKEVERFFMKLEIITTDRSTLDEWSALLMEKVK